MKLQHQVDFNSREPSVENWIQQKEKTSNTQQQLGPTHRGSEKTHRSRSKQTSNGVKWTTETCENSMHKRTGIQEHLTYFMIYPAEYIWNRKLIPTASAKMQDLHINSSCMQTKIESSAARVCNRYNIIDTLQICDRDVSVRPCGVTFVLCFS